MPKKSKNIRKGKNRKSGPAPSNPPTSYGTTQKSSAPRVRNTTRGMCITHREYIGKFIATKEGFELSHYRINPGDAQTFPWLSALASRFETYRLDRCQFEYITRMPTTKSGSITMATDYDVSDNFPIDEVELMGNQGAVMAPVYRSSIMRCGKASMMGGYTRKYNSPADVPGYDQKTYDAGRFYIAATHSSGELFPELLGHIWVSYTVEFFTPQLHRTVDVPEAQVLCMGSTTDVPILGSLGATSLAITNTNINGIRGASQDTTSNVLRIKLPVGTYSLNTLLNLYVSQANAGNKGEKRFHIDFGTIDTQNSLYSLIANLSDTTKFVDSTEFRMTENSNYIFKVVAPMAASVWYTVRYLADGFSAGGLLRDEAQRIDFHKL